jgi:hypothetical protein
MIAWRYLDKKTATITALKDFENMTCIIQLTPDEIKAAEGDMTSPGCSSIDGLPYVRNLLSQEDRVVNSLSRMSVLNQRYIQAVEFMNWFKPAWDTLCEEEQIVLSDFYLVAGSKADLVEGLSERLQCGRSDVYRRKDKAVEQLSVLLFGY